jgi:hypothetical protein
MKEIKEFINKKYMEIPEDEKPQIGETFICLTTDSDDPFKDWDFAVGRVGEDGRARPWGIFKTPQHARIFANNI